MGKTALLVSREEMLCQAHNILQEKKYTIGEMRVIRTEDAVSEARESIARGASVIIARGLQASLIKQYTDIPVVEIVATAQEMALLVMKAKQILKKPNPVIGVVGLKNMFCDMSYFDDLYGIDLRVYFAESGEQLKDAAARAVRDGVDLLIGGDTAVRAAEEAGIPSLFLSITEDSLRNAFSVAESMEYAMDVQKRREAQMETLLDNSFNGVARIDASGRVTDINPMLEHILQKKKEEVASPPPGEVFSELEGESFRQVLEEGEASYSLFLRINRISLLAVVAPVRIDGKTDGAIMTCHRMKKEQTEKEESRSRRAAGGFPALGTFDDILCTSRAMEDCVRLAKLYALSERPVLITGEAGLETRLLARSIHNASLREGEPFVEVSCDGVGEEAQTEMLFGDKGAALQAKSGSLLIEDVEALSRSCQYRLCQLIRYKRRVGSQATQYPVLNVRVIAVSGAPLERLVAKGLFREDLYYLLKGLTLEVPPLRERREDLEHRIEESIRECCERYSRYHVLTRGARDFLMSYPWEGNRFQVESFCERLILSAQSRSLDERDVENLMGKLYPAQRPEGCLTDDCPNADGLAAGRSKSGAGMQRMGSAPLPEEADHLRETLERLGGNRGKTAEALGISKSTLWRKMKKYGLR